MIDADKPSTPEYSTLDPSVRGVRRLLQLLARCSGQRSRYSASAAKDYDGLAALLATAEP